MEFKEIFESIYKEHKNLNDEIVFDVKEVESVLLKLPIHRALDYIQEQIKQSNYKIDIKKIKTDNLDTNFKKLAYMFQNFNIYNCEYEFADPTICKNEKLLKLLYETTEEEKIKLIDNLMHKYYCNPIFMFNEDWRVKFNDYKSLLRIFAKKEEKYILLGNENVSLDIKRAIVLKNEEDINYCYDRKTYLILKEEIKKSKVDYD